MNTKAVMFVIGGLLFGGILAGLLYYANAQNNSSGTANEQELTELPSPTPSPAPREKYQHEAGFSFEHPADIEISEDDLAANEYADLLLQSTTTSGQITIQIIDTKLKDLAAWKKENKEAIDSMKSQEIQLGDLTAWEEGLTEGMITTTAVGDGVLYTIEVEPGEDVAYWHDVYSTIIESFTFELPPEDEETVPPPASSGGGSTGDDIIFEGEEIIE